MYNRIILMGRLTADPQMKISQNGVKYCKFVIAVDRAYSKAEGKQTDFLEVTCWRNTAEFVANYFRKGKPIHIEGTLQSGTYVDDNGIKRNKIDIIAESVAFCGDSNSHQQSKQGMNPYQ